jgi:hypothetical protein
MSSDAARRSHGARAASVRGRGTARPLPLPIGGVLQDQRGQDGRLIHDYFLAEVKKLDEVKQGRDIRAIVPATSVLRPIDQGYYATLDPV